MSSFPVCTDVLADSVPLLPLPDVAERLGLVVTRVHQMVRDRRFLVIRRAGVVGAPAEFFGSDGALLKFLPGLISVLTDGGYSPDEILRWLFTPDESLGGTPVAALHTDSAREVVRRAQAMAF